MSVQTYFICVRMSSMGMALVGTKSPNFNKTSPKRRPASAAGLPSTTSVIHKQGSVGVSGADFCSSVVIVASTFVSSPLD